MTGEASNRVLTCIDGWRSGWLWVGAYDPAPGFAVLRTGVVGDVVAAFTIATEDGFSEALYLRWDPARDSVDLLMKPDLDTPWSLESTHIAGSQSHEAIQDALEEYDADPTGLFDLLVAVNPDLEITPISDADIPHHAGEGTYPTPPDRSHRWIPTDHQKL